MHSTSCHVFPFLIHNADAPRRDIPPDQINTFSSTERLITLWSGLPPRLKSSLFGFCFANPFSFVLSNTVLNPLTHFNADAKSYSHQN